MKDTKIAEKEFAEWASVADQNPAAFEDMRLAAIQAYIESVPEESRERLRRLQWRIDQERRLARTPMNACIRLSRMMWQNVLGPGGLRERLGELGGVLQGDSKPQFDSQDEQNGQVLAFARASD